MTSASFRNRNRTSRFRSNSILPHRRQFLKPQPNRSSGKRLTCLAVVTVFGLIAASCGGSTDEQVVVNGTETQISLATVELIESALDHPRAELDFSDPIALDPSECLLHNAWPNQLLDAPATPFLQLPSGSLMQGPGEGVAQSALEVCFDEADLMPTADGVAAIVLDLDVTPSQLQLLTPNMATFLEPYGVDYQPPTLVQEGDSSTTTFFANDFQLVGVLRVTATRSSDGTLTVDYTDL